MRSDQRGARFVYFCVIKTRRLQAVINELLNRHGFQLDSLILGGHFRLTENFWMHAFPRVKNIRCTYL